MQGFLPPLEGLLHSAAQFDQAAANVTRASLPQTARPDTVDLSAAAVALLVSKNSFEANTRVVQAVDEMDRAVISMMG